jgi:hypothetical protein
MRGAADAGLLFSKYPRRRHPPLASRGSLAVNSDLEVFLALGAYHIEQDFRI